MLRFKTVLSCWQCQYLQVMDDKPRVFLNDDETIDFDTAASQSDDSREVTCPGNEDHFSSNIDSSLVNDDETIDLATTAAHSHDSREVTCPGNKDQFLPNVDSLLATAEVNRNANCQHVPVKAVVDDSRFEISAQTICIELVMKGTESFMLTIPAYLFYNKDGKYCDDDTAQEIIFTELCEYVLYMMCEFQYEYDMMIVSRRENILQW